MTHARQRKPSIPALSFVARHLRACEVAIAAAPAGPLLPDNAAGENSTPSAVERNASDLVDEIAEAIALYVSAHPSACDNRRGVGGWWLPTRLATAPSALVDQAIANLVREGRLTTIKSPDGTVLFTAGKVSRPQND
jgi:hypothetical protein